MKLSIIVPIYNAEKYLSKCLEEIASCPSNEIECLLINDGSTDASLDICEAYAVRDARFRVITKPNAGVSAARNTGLSSAAGKYVLFLDADDYVDSGKWKTILQAVEEDQDFIAFSYYTLHQDGAVTEELFDIGTHETRDITAIRKLLLGSAVLNTCWAKLLRLDIIQDNDLLFREDLKIGEDAVFILEYLQQARTCVLRNESILYYRQHAESVMHKLDIHAKLAEFKELFDFRKSLLGQWTEHQFTEAMYREAFSVITNLLLNFSLKAEHSECRRVFKNVLENEMVKDIMIHTQVKSLRAIYKKIEFYIMKCSAVRLLSLYFKLKNRYI